MAHEHEDAAETECEFCMGREAAHLGDLADANPFAPADAAPRSVAWYQSPFGLWAVGHSIGEAESGRRQSPEESLLGYERRERTVILERGFHPSSELLAAVKRGDPTATRLMSAERVDDVSTYGGEIAWLVSYWAATD